MRCSCAINSRPGGCSCSIHSIQFDIHVYQKMLFTLIETLFKLFNIGVVHARIKPKKNLSRKQWKNEKSNLVNDFEPTSHHHNKTKPHISMCKWNGCVETVWTLEKGCVSYKIHSVNTKCEYFATFLCILHSFAFESVSFYLISTHLARYLLFHI